ncbi:MAG: zinc ribbon domain-containing protein [Christensenellaceae bacterium]
MNELNALLEYQQAETKLEDFESALKNTEIRKKLVKQQQLFQSAQRKLKQLEQETYLTQNLLGEVMGQAEILKKQLGEKNEEIAEMKGDDVEDLFLEDVREMIKECENIRNSIELNKRKVVDAVHSLEKAETEIKETLKKMSIVKKNFDQLKEAHEKELAAGKDDLEKLRGNVQKAAKKVDQTLLEQYKKIKQQKANPVVPFKNGRCQGCNMDLPSGVVQSLKTGDKLITCENCGRILYLAED